MQKMGQVSKAMDKLQETDAIEWDFELRNDTRVS